MLLFARPTVVTALVVILIIYPLASLSSTSMHVCENSSISIKSDELVDHNTICDSAEDALAFFGRLDIEHLHPLVIKIVRKLPGWMSETSVGCYRKEEQKIYMLAFPEFKKKEVWFDVPINRLMYSSLVAHEVAHAVASHNLSISEPTIHAQEYVAYVAMFIMMNPALRSRVLAENLGANFDSELEINEITYMLDPMRFGIAAYRHYLNKEHGDAFLLKVLSGNELTYSAQDLP
ncbi:MAG: hypothetical protein HKP55_04510 [Gammaproteobacteria bacterium]|nr:hypothetical protein [Gammaproteobacteria bacterium]